MKSDEGRECKIARRTHSTNNVHLSYNVKTKTLFQKCFSKNCIGKCKLIYKAQDPSGALCSRRNLPASNDTALALEFIEWHSLIMFEQDLNLSYMVYF